jgi:hypothetical protein
VTDQISTSGASPAPSGGTGSSHGGAPNGSSPSNPFNAPPVNPRSQGHSPALDARQQQQTNAQQAGDGGGQQQTTAAPSSVEIDGVSWTHDQLREAVAHRLEDQARRASLPTDPRSYKTTLPPDFKAPEGVNFEFDERDPALQHFRQVAHARGMSQDDFSSALGAFAATKIAEQTQLAHARNAELGKLGSAGQARIEAVSTWLRARAGGDAEVICNQLKNFPHSTMVRAFEAVMKAFSDQGGANYSQSGRQQVDTTPRMPTELTTYEQKRAWQEQVAGRGDR